MEEKMPNAQEFCLRWNNFHSSLVSALDGFKNDEDFVDVTLACEGQFLKAHKMLLSACSVFFRDLLKANPCQHPIVILPPEVKFNDLEKLLRFIYQGEVNVQQENLARFLKTAEMLKIRGLAEDNDKMLRSSPRPPDTGDPPNGSPKRPRLSTEIMSAGPQTPHSHNDDSRLSGGDSDSEMIPVKQEMVVEFKDNDAMYEGGESEPFSAEAYLREGGSTTSSSQPHPPPPPPPGPLIPSYVPPPQVKSQDDSLQGSHLQDEITQDWLARLEVLGGTAATAAGDALCADRGVAGAVSGAGGGGGGGSGGVVGGTGIGKMHGRSVHNTFASLGALGAFKEGCIGGVVNGGGGGGGSGGAGGGGAGMILGLGGAAGGESEGRLVACPVCGKRVQFSYLNLHLKRTHDSVEVRCPLCAKVFKNKHSLGVHQARYHPKTSAAHAFLLPPPLPPPPYSSSSVSTVSPAFSLPLTSTSSSGTVGRTPAAAVYPPSNSSTTTYSNTNNSCSSLTSSPSLSLSLPLSSVTPHLSSSSSSSTPASSGGHPLISHGGSESASETFHSHSSVSASKASPIISPENFLTPHTLPTANNTTTPTVLEQHPDPHYHHGHHQQQQPQPPQSPAPSTHASLCSPPSYLSPSQHLLVAPPASSHALHHPP